ncbi:hypothetical protein M23134_08095 [Microscilla marina ATCC 23134]|uniref:Uncharacterized protein n=1 Tax=Microscilla marina ATCC 23134 TaxID=313606 RepID=A1ZH02_MICM2|nr:hypothetical protein M23134_08095 [Microscilla marina ATCC 23134]
MPGKKYKGFDVKRWKHHKLYQQKINKFKVYAILFYRENE